MSQNYAELERNARLLSPEERARLAETLLASFRDPGVAVIEAQWAVEIERRVLAYERAPHHSGWGGTSKTFARPVDFAASRSSSG